MLLIISYYMFLQVPLVLLDVITNLNKFFNFCDLINTYHFYKLIIFTCCNIKKYIIKKIY